MKRSLIRLFLIIVGLLIGIVLLAGAAELAVRFEPVTAPAPSVTGDYVQLAADERLFTLFAALNAAGYDEENYEQGFSDVRRTVRATLAEQSLPSLARLRPYLAMCRFIHVSQCATWVLQRGPAPDFARSVDGWAIRAPALLFLGFDRALADFYQEAGIAALWQTQQPAYAAEIERYRALVEPAVAEVFAYLRLTAPPTAGVRVLPNLLDAYWRGYGPHVGALSYVVMGPAIEPNVGLIQHEAMHPILNPLVDAHLDAIAQDEADRLFAALKPRVGAGYQNWPAILHESVIRAVEVRLADPTDRERLLLQEEAQGFPLVRPLAEQLAEYETSGATMATYLPTLLAVLNDVPID
ncbi:MAG: hypothetical protein BroJett021_09500 [Chloroflexota bacterium]|nr:MAG: hypothetical protein BroJett021_09500 [Chloroflexota bacterium]